MGIFTKFKNNNLTNLKENPLGYWEEKSYFIVIPERKDYSWTPEEVIKRISSLKEVKVIKNSFDNDTKTYYLNLKYDDEIYELGFYPGGFTLPESYLNTILYLPKDEIEKLKEAKSALTMFMKFNKDAKKSYHLELKLACAAIPNLIGLVDESAEKIIPKKWALLAAASKVTPGPSDLFNVQAIFGKKGEIWLHTHGLCRCGLTELEVVNSNADNYKKHYNLINAFASFLIDKQGNFNPEIDSAPLGILPDGTPIVATYKSWTKALNEYKKLKIGGLSERMNGHNSHTSLIFLYKNADDEKNKVLSKVTDYDNLWGDDIVFFFSDAETERMKTLATERFDYIKEAFKNKNQILVKIGLACDNKQDTEHIWFEITDFKGEKFKAKLTQEPYEISDIHVGDERWFTKKDITDWEIHVNDFIIGPSDVYLLDYK